MRIRSFLCAVVGASALAFTSIGCGTLPEIQGMSICEKGQFSKGYAGPGAKQSEGPVETKTISKSFYIDTFEVSNKAYKAFCDRTHRPTPPQWKNGNFPAGQDEFPVTNVTYEDAKAFAQDAGKRLPDAIEWEYAARGPDSKLYPWGNQWEKGKCNSFEEGKGSPVRCGEYSQGKSWCGAIDMAGNVWEWTATPVPTDANAMIIKGGSYAPLEDKPRASINGTMGKDKSDGKTGFRCVKDPG